MKKNKEKEGNISLLIHSLPLGRHMYKKTGKNEHCYRKGQVAKKQMWKRYLFITEYLNLHLKIKIFFMGYFGKP